MCCLSTECELGSPNLAVLQGPSSQSRVMIFKQQFVRGSFYGKDHMGNTRKWKPPPPASFLQSSSGWVQISCVPGPPTDISKSQGAHGLPVAAGGLKPPLHHELQSSLHAGKPAALPGQASSGVGQSQTTTGNWTRSLSHTKLCLLRYEFVRLVYFTRARSNSFPWQHITKTMI